MARRILAHRTMDLRILACGFLAHDGFEMALKLDQILCIKNSMGQKHGNAPMIKKINLSSALRIFAQEACPLLDLKFYGTGFYLPKSPAP